MLVVGKAVDHGDGGMLRHGGTDVVSECPDHDPVDPPLEVLGHIIHRLPFSQVDVGRRQRNRAPPKLGDTHRECRSGPERGLFEYQGHEFPLQ